MVSTKYGVRVSIQVILPTEELQEILLLDGWDLEEVEERHLRIRHPQVEDEEQARGRLYPLGLLTSARIRIEFQRYTF